MADQQPRCKQNGFSFESLDLQGSPVLIFNGFRAEMFKHIIEIQGESVLSLVAPEVSGGPLRLSAKFDDENGNRILEIENNEWKVGETNWDVVVEGARITIRSGLGQIALVLRSEPPTTLVVERMRMLVKRHIIEGNELDGFWIIFPDGRKSPTIRGGGAAFFRAVLVIS